MDQQVNINYIQHDHSNKFSSAATVLLLAVYIVLAICVVYLLANGISRIINNITNTRHRIQAFHEQRRAGGRGDIRNALLHINAITEPTVQDRFMRAELVRFHILDDAPVGGAVVVDGLPADVVLNDYNTIINMMLDGVPADAHILARIGDGWAGPGLTIGANAAQRVDNARRAKAAIADSDTKIEAAKKYIESAIVHTNDPQSVHDTKVNMDLRMIIQRIDAPVNVLSQISDAHMYISKRNDIHQQNAVKVLTKMAEGIYNSTLDEKEDKIFALTWNRASLPENASQRDNIRDAVYLALADCIEHGNMVCSNGRCAKVLGALALVDTDTTLVPRVREDYANQIYRETLKILDDELELAQRDPDSDIRAAAEAYYELDGLDNATPENAAATELKRRIKKRIDDNIDTYDIFSPDEKQNLKETCYISAVL